MGGREFANGVAILARPASAGRVWARVAGDAVDLALLSASTAESAHRNRTALATVAVAAVTVADVLCAYRLNHIDERARQDGARIHAAAAVTIGLPISNVYDFWQNFDSFPGLCAIWNR
jgi:uncharacterized membrane protein